MEGECHLLEQPRKSRHNQVGDKIGCDIMLISNSNDKYRRSCNRADTARHREMKLRVWVQRISRGSR